MRVCNPLGREDVKNRLQGKCIWLSGSLSLLRSLDWRKVKSKLQKRCATSHERQKPTCSHWRVLTGALRGMRASLAALFATSSCFGRCAKGQRCRHGRGRCSACRPVAEMTRCMGKKVAMTMCLGRGGLWTPGNYFSWLYKSKYGSSMNSSRSWTIDFRPCSPMVDSAPVSLVRVKLSFSKGAVFLHPDTGAYDFNMCIGRKGK